MGSCFGLGVTLEDCFWAWVCSNVGFGVGCGFGSWGGTGGAFELTGWVFGLGGLRWGMGGWV